MLARVNDHVPTYTFLLPKDNYVYNNISIIILLLLKAMLKLVHENFKQHIKILYCRGVQWTSVPLSPNFMDTSTCLLLWYWESQHNSKLLLFTTVNRLILASNRLLIFQMSKFSLIQQCKSVNIPQNYMIWKYDIRYSSPSSLNT